MALVTQEMLKPRYDHCMEHATSDSKYFPSLLVRQVIDRNAAHGWELVSVVCDPDDQDNGFCKVLLFFKRPVGSPPDESKRRDFTNHTTMSIRA